ncbi:cell division protein, partial [Pseudomonas syringae pv. syringae FF5]
FTREDETRQVQVEAPAAPQAPAAAQVRVDPVPVPEPQVLPQEPVPGDDDMSSSQPPAMPIAPAPTAPAA